MLSDLIEKIQNNKEIKVVSFELINTLILRAAANPSFVFLKMYDMNPELFPKYTNKYDWKNSRIIAEKVARVNKKNVDVEAVEITLPEIYKMLPSAYKKNADKLMNLEVECEKEVCFLNDDIYETIKYIKEKLKLKVILIADIYLSKSQIETILKANNIDINLFTDIFISCEYNALKRNGGLFKIVFDKLNIKSNELFHVGSDIYGDIGAANALNIDSFYYTLITESSFKYPYLRMEEMAYSFQGQQLFPLRLLATSHNPYEDEKDREYFDMGAMVIGPFFTLFSEWVLDIAQENNISVIRPIMREGMFLTKLLKNVQSARGLNYSIEPLYLSRLSLQTSTLEYITRDDIKNMLITPNLTLRKIAEILDLEEEVKEKYPEILDYTSEQIINSGYLYELYNYFISADVIKSIKNKSAGHSKNIIDYFEQMGLNQKSITVDIGWRGSVPSTMHKIFKVAKKEGNVINLFAFSDPYVANNTISGCDIRGFIGNYGSFSREVSEVYINLIEMFLFSLDGTTVRYERKKDKVVPITLDIKYPKWQIDVMNKIQEGILEFQKVYLAYKKKKPMLSNWDNSNIDVCRIMNRMFCYPELSEVNLLKDVVFDQNFGANVFVPILNPMLIGEGTDMLELKHKFNPDINEWYAALDVLKNPTVHYENVSNIFHNHYFYSVVILTKRILEKINDNKFVLIGAGSNTKTLICILKSLGKLDLVEGIIENNAFKHGLSIYGKKIYGMGHKFDSNIYFCTIARKDLRDSIYNQMCDIKKDFKFITFFDE